MSRRISPLLGAALVLTLAAWSLSRPMPAGAHLAAPASFAIVNVTTTTDEYDGVPNGDCSLREAIQSQNDNTNFGGCMRGIVPGPGGTDTILLTSGTYTLTRTGADDDLNLTGDLDLRASVIISATQPLIPNVVGNANWNDRLLHVLSGTVTIQGLAVSGGAAGDGLGGGMLIEAGATVSVSGGSFTHNSAYRGGGLYNDSGVLTLVNSAVSANNALGGFGSAGGGLYNKVGTLTLINTAISQNEALSETGGGGGVYNALGTLALSGVTLFGNSSPGPGGAIWVLGGTAALTNTTIIGNGSGNVGGGLGSTNATLTLTNVTLTENVAPATGGGIYSSGSDAALTLVNTIVADSLLAENCGPTPFTFTGSANLSSDGSCEFGAGRDNVDVLLGPLADNGGLTLTIMPLPGSPALNSGTNTGCPATDQRGEPRPQGAACEVGAVEVEGPTTLRLFIPLALR